MDAHFGSALAALLAEPRLPSLGRGTPARQSAESLHAWAAAPDLGQPVRDPLAATACVVGMYLHFDFWTEAHTLAQDLPTPEGAYWHAILHRREPDAANAKYWFRQVSTHPVAQAMCAEPGYSTPTRFVDLCEQVRGTNSVAEERACRLQLLEWRRLLEHCWKQAT